MSPLILILILAAIQGLAEFLPISSSGHLVLFREYLPGGKGLPHDASVEVLLHFGTLLAILLFYRKDVIFLARGLFGYGPDPASARRTIFLLVLATLPVVVIGLLLRDQVESLFDYPRLVSVALVVTGLVLAFSSRIPHRERRVRDLSPGGALLIGFAQAFSVIPGISRSAMTIVMGLRSGLSGQASAKFSFLLAIPALIGATIVKIPDLSRQVSKVKGDGGPELHSGEGPGIELALVGVIVSFLVGYLALVILLKMARNRQLPWFAPYCWLVGVAGFAYSFLG